MRIFACARARYRVLDVILVHDDLDRALGKLGIKHGGSASGTATKGTVTKDTVTKDY